MMQPLKTLRKRSGTTLAGTFGAAVMSVLLLCGAGNTPAGNIQTGDVNANGHAITNAANVATANLNVSTLAALPANTTLGGTNFGTAAATAAVTGSVDPRTMNLNGCAFVFEGDSITFGFTLSSPTTQCFGYLASQMPFFKGHGTYFNDAVTGSTIAPGTNGGNNISDRYVANVKPLRPAANGGSGGPRAYLFLMIGTNDIDALGDTGAQVISALNTYIAQAQSDGFTVILSPITPRSNFTAGSVMEGYREQVNAAIRLGQNATAGSATVVPSNGVLDYASTLANAGNTALYGDGLHPTALGHQLIANYINSAMTAGGSQLTPLPTTVQEQVNFAQPVSLTGGIVTNTTIFDANTPQLHFYTQPFGNAGSGTGADLFYTLTGGIGGTIPANAFVINTHDSSQTLAFAINLQNNLSVSSSAVTSAVPLLSDGFKDTSGHTNAPAAFDGSGNLVPLNLGSGVAYNTSTKTLSATGSGGTVTQVNTGVGLTGGPVTSIGALSVSTTSGSNAISSTGTTTLTANGLVNSNALTFGAGSGAYTSSIVLSDSGIFSGMVYEIFCSLPASTNPTVNIYDGSTSGTLLATLAGNGGAYATTLKFVNSFGGWTIYKKGAALVGVANNFAQPQTITNTGAQQLTLAYDGSHSTTFSTGSTGVLTIAGAANTMLVPGTLQLQSTPPGIPVGWVNAGSFIISTLDGGFGYRNGLVAGVNSGVRFSFDWMGGNSAACALQQGGSDSVIEADTGTLGTLIQLRAGSISFSGASDTQISRSSAGVVSMDTSTLGNGAASIVAAGETIGGGTKVTAIKLGTGTLSSGSATLSDSAISSTSAIIVTHLGSSVTNAGALLAYPTGSGAGTVKSANSSDNDTFTYIVVNH